MTDQELFCNVIRAAMFPQTHPMPDIRREQYGILYETLDSHALASLPDKLPQKEDMPEALRAQWQKKIYTQKLRFGQYLSRQDAVLHIFSQAGIPCVILKGTVSASYYPEPAYRAMGDLDLLVRPCDREKAARLLTEDGFRQSGYQDEVEQGFIKDSLLLELHTGASADGKYAGTVNDFLLDRFAEAESKTLYGFQFPCLPEICNGLILLDHLRHHLRDSLGFRQVIDWMMYADAHLDDEAWASDMRGLFARCGLERFAIVTTAMCQRYFGLRTEGIGWTQSADPALCEELFAHIYAIGNFGRKLEANQKSAAGMLRDRSLWQVLKGLQKVGLDNWALCHKHPWLKPFAWLYQIFLYLYRIVAERYNMSVALVIKERRRYRQALKLMEKLGLRQGAEKNEAERKL